MWKTRVISDDGLSVTPDGIAVDIRLPWYRSLPLSTLRGATLKINGQEIPPERLSLEVEGVDYRLDETEALVDRWWHILDSGTLHAHDVHLQKGTAYDVDVTLSIEIPYVAGAVLSSNCVKSLRAA